MFSLASLQKIKPLRPMNMAWKQHFYFGYDLVSELKPKRLVELGAHLGESYFTFCQAVREQKLQTQCFAIDTWTGDSFTGPYREDVFESMIRHSRAFYGDFSRLIRKKFSDALQEFEDGSVDLLHIDGSHDEASVRADFESWLRKMGPGGIVLFHDIAVREPGFGVWKVWEELKDSYSTFEFEHGYGLGVLKVTREHRFESAFLNELFELSPTQAEAARQYYRRRQEELAVGMDASSANSPAWTRQLGGRKENLALHRTLDQRVMDRIRAGGRVQLDVILQTHAESNSQSEPRYCGAPKREVTLRCLNSLVRTLNLAGNHIDARLVVLDDHSSEAAVAGMRKILSKLKHPHLFLPLSERGIMNSIRSCYDWGLTHGRGELIYFVQDDYLHFDSAIEEMVDSYLRFRLMLGGAEVAIYPFDDPFRYYAPMNIENTRVVYGSKRHWRRNFFTPCMFMASQALIRQEKEMLFKLAASEIGPRMEDESINRIWQDNRAVLFTPIPSLALHLQHETEKDPFLDWSALWEKNADH